MQNQQLKNLSVDLGKRTYSLSKGNKVILSGKIDDLITDPGTSNGSNATTSSGKTLLYTGANYIAYTLSAVAIVAIAIVVRKRA